MRIFLKILFLSILVQPAPGFTQGRISVTDSIKVQMLNDSAFALYGIDPAKMLEYSFQILEIANESNYRSGRATGFTVSGLSHLSTGNYKEALDNFLDALRIRETSNDRLAHANILSNIGVVYYYLNDHSRSLEYHKKAYDIRKKLGNESHIARSLNNIGIAYKNMNRLDSAMIFYSQALELKRKTLDSLGISNSLNNVGRIYLQQGKYDEAIDYYQESLTIDIRLKNRLNTATSYSNLGEAHLALNHFKISEDYLTEAVAIGEELNANQVLLLAYDRLAILYERTFRYKGALDWRKKYSEINDKLNSATINAEIKNLEVKYENEKVTLENDLLKERNTKNELLLSRQRIWLIVGLVIAVSLTLFLFNYIRLYRLRNAVAKLEQEKNNEISERNRLISEQNLELQRISNAKNKLISVLAHDIRSPFNDIRNILSLASDNTLSIHEAREYLELVSQKTDTVSGMIMNVLDWIKSQMEGITIEKKDFQVKEVLDDILSVCGQAITNKKLVIKNSVPDGLNIYSDVNMIKVIIRNLLSNAIKFTGSGGEIEFSSKKEGEYVFISISDSGEGMTQADIDQVLSDDNFTTLGTEKEEGTGLGMMLIKEFIVKLGGNLQIDSTPSQGTTFTFSVPSQS